MDKETAIERAREKRKNLVGRSEQMVAYIDAHRLANEYEQALKEQRAEALKVMEDLTNLVTDGTVKTAREIIKSYREGVE